VRTLGSQEFVQMDANIKALFGGFVERHARAAAMQLSRVKLSPSRSILRCQPR
jgi:hypothetical protein